LPASRDIDIHALTDLLGAKVQMAPEPQLSRLFPDCEPGAIPAVGEAYDLKTVADTSLRSQEQIYFEAGDHEELICLSRAEFERLLKNSLFASFSFEPPRDRYDA
jgi:Ala-tRNA(Pro) deacylase